MATPPTMRGDRILITGASSGIGEALARVLARPGRTLVLLARDAAGLVPVAGWCRAVGAEARTEAADVTDRARMTAIIAEAAPLDVVFANAGIAYGIGPDGRESDEQIRRTLAVNVDGVLNTVLPAIELMVGQPPDRAGVRGRIVVSASVAALIAYPNTPSYCASKAAIDAWTVATAANLAPRGVLLTSACPGFVRTRMTAVNAFPMPGLIGADRAARLMVRAASRGDRRVAFPGWIAAGSRLVDLLPSTLREAVLRRQPTGAPPPMPTG